MQKNNIVLSVFKGVLALSIITLVCTVLLGVVNIITYINPLDMARERFNKFSGKTYSEIQEVNSESNGGKVVYYGLSNDKEMHAFLAEGRGYNKDIIEVYVFIKKDGKIDKVELGDHSETFIKSHLIPNGYFEQYKDRNIESLSESNITTVSGATKSSIGIRAAVFAVRDYYKTLSQNNAPTGSGSSVYGTASLNRGQQLASSNDMTTHLMTNSSVNTDNIINLLSIQGQESVNSKLDMLKNKIDVLENSFMLNCDAKVKNKLFYRQGGAF